MTEVVEAADRLGLIVGESGHFDVEDVIGPMSGLDMSKYRLEHDPDACGWRLVRR